jgi:hypothetical protein
MGNRAETLTSVKGYGKAMDKIPYMLTHFKKDCGLEFAPTNTDRLLSEKQYAEAYKYQDLLRGVCPHCKVEVAGWIGIDFLLETVKYHSINDKKIPKWIDRFDTDLVRPHVKNAHSTVKGTVKDRNSGNWFYKTNISVA